MQLEFVESTFLPYLLGAQNDDGGWGFTTASSSRVEPTAWALLAFQSYSDTSRLQPSSARATQFLVSSQLPNGSWPASSESSEGCWVTSLAAWALCAYPEYSERVRHALEWLASEIPGEAKALRRLVRSFLSKKSEVAQNQSYFGWSWTSGTASWVEPTAYALILIRKWAIPQTAAMERRTQLATDMLVDRMCPGGGWNCGNPMVYGVAGEPQVGPTVWALLALRSELNRPQVTKSLEWLIHYRPSIQSPGSLALAQIALNAYNQPDPTISGALLTLYGREDIFWTVPEVAWATIGLGGPRDWPAAMEPTMKSKGSE